MSDRLFVDDPRESPAPRPHSVLGILSCVMAAIAFVFVFGSVGMACYLTATGGMGPEAEDGPAMAVGCVAILGVGGAVAGAVLGVIALFERGRNPLCGILGTVFNGVIILGLIALIVIGSVME